VDAAEVAVVGQLETGKQRNSLPGEAAPEVIPQEIKQPRWVIQMLLLEKQGRRVKGIGLKNKYFLAP